MKKTLIGVGVIFVILTGCMSRFYVFRQQIEGASEVALLVYDTSGLFDKLPETDKPDFYAPVESELKHFWKNISVVNGADKFELQKIAWKENQPFPAWTLPVALGMQQEYGASPSRWPTAQFLKINRRGESSAEKKLLFVVVTYQQEINWVNKKKNGDEGDSGKDNYFVATLWIIDPITGKFLEGSSPGFYEGGREGFDLARFTLRSEKTEKWTLWHILEDNTKSKNHSLKLKEVLKQYQKQIHELFEQFAKAKKKEWF